MSNFLNQPTKGANAGDDESPQSIVESGFFPVNETISPSTESSGDSSVSAESIVISSAGAAAAAAPASRNIFSKLFGPKKKAASANVLEVGVQGVVPSADGTYDDVIVPSDAAREQAIDAHSLSRSREQEIIRDIGKKPDVLPVIGRLPAKTQYAVSFGLLVGSLTLAIGLAGAGFFKASQYQARAEAGTRLQMLSQRMLSTTQYAISGSRESAAQLQASRDDVNEQFQTLLHGTSSLNPMSLDESAALAKTHATMTQEILPLVEQVLSLSGSLAALSKNAEDLDRIANSLYSSAEQLMALLQSNGSPTIHVSAADHLRMLAERVRSNGLTLLTSTSSSVEPLAQYNSDVTSMRQTIDTLLKGDEVLGMPALADPQALAIVDELTPVLTELNGVTAFIEKSARSIVTVRRNLQTLTVKSEEALRNSTVFTTEMQDISQSAYGRVYISSIFVLMALLSLALISLVNNRSTKMDAWEAAFRNKRNEKDIIDFMEACLPLEMGDLTVRFNQNMEAMEGVTGGIRNSVNEAVISLNEAVGTVKRTASDVTVIVSDSVRNTTAMKDANERQAHEISDVESRVSDLSTAIDDVTSQTLVAARATESARIASEEGERVVAETNEKMGHIRANMQGVLKSVKHLGETSQEIGAIVNTIEMITDRTQVLAVNASLEAAKAGAAGTGFSIIAGEVNRLAEQSADALRTITALVQRVQGETSGTIRAVEESTANVVEGANLSEVANTQLKMISSLASDLSNIMERIRTQSASQSTNAKEVRISMDRLAQLSNEVQGMVTQVVGGVQQIEASMGSLQGAVQIFTTEAQEAA